MLLLNLKQRILWKCYSLNEIDCSSTGCNRLNDIDRCNLLAGLSTGSLKNLY